YMPNVPHTAMLTSAGELNTSGHITLKGNVSVNSAYAVSNHFGILLNGSLMNNNRPKKDFKHNLLETGAGYFTSFGKDRSRIFELYAGFGKGNSTRIVKDMNEEELLMEDRQE